MTDKANDELYFQEEGIAIYNSNILEVSIQNGSLDLIVTSPPYNVDIKYASNDDELQYSDYLTFSGLWLEKCFNLVKDDGRFCLNIPLDKNKGGHNSVYADLVTIAKKLAGIILLA